MAHSPDISEKKILAAIHKNRPEGWELLFTQFDPMIQAIARWPKWNFSEDEQLDVRQNIHVQLQSALASFQGKSSLAWFIKRIAINQCVDEIRRQKRWRSVIAPSVQKASDGRWSEVDFQDQAAADPHAETARKERIDSLREVLHQLNQTCRDSISLYYLKQHSYLEISEKLGISIKTVGSRLSKCLDKLHQQLRQHPAFKRKRT